MINKLLPDTSTAVADASCIRSDQLIAGNFSLQGFKISIALDNPLFNGSSTWKRIDAIKKNKLRK